MSPEAGLLGSRFIAISRVVVLASAVAMSALWPAPVSVYAQSIQLHKHKKKEKAEVVAPAKPQDPGHVLANADQKLTVGPNETFFAIFAALNACGYDQELDKSNPLRKTIRDEVQERLQASSAAQLAATQVCSFYHDHDLGDASRNLAQYVSLGLFTTQPPNIVAAVKEADLPPDAGGVLGFLPLLQRFYDAANLHELWLRHQGDYDQIIGRIHDPLHEMIVQTDLYLKQAFTGVADRRFAVIVAPQGSPGQVNARNYGSDYYIVVSPDASDGLKLDQIRHTYLHYVLDPYALSRGSSMRRLQPLLDSVRTAPLDDAYKSDITLLVIESLIKATEARMIKPEQAISKTDKKEAEAQQAALEANRSAVVDQAMAQGYILTRYFYGRLAEFEKGPTSFKDDFGDMIYAINVPEQKKIAENTNFAAQSSREVLAKSEVAGGHGIQLAEQKLAQGDYRNAQRLAQEVVDAEGPESGRALFVLALTSSKEGEMQEARSYFERTLQVAKDPHLIAWSHIYLGRIADIQDDRETALRQYSSALNSGDEAADTKAAAQKGLDHPLQPPKSAQKN
ncbi:MAG: tetratricopeptide repeat protein [Acidobacteriaceae bacterium]